MLNTPGLQLNKGYLTTAKPEDWTFRFKGCKDLDCGSCGHWRKYLTGSEDK